MICQNGSERAAPAKMADKKTQYAI